MRLLLIALLLCIGCAAAKPPIDWRGKHRDQLILANGVPSGETELSDGTKLVEYKYSRIIYPDPMVPVERYCVVQFFIAPDGLIRETKRRGNSC